MFVLIEYFETYCCNVQAYMCMYNCLQTTELGAEITGPHHLYADLEFKVTAVSAEGVVAEDYPQYPGQHRSDIIDGEILIIRLENVAYYISSLHFI